MATAILRTAGPDWSPKMDGLEARIWASRSTLAPVPNRGALAVRHDFAALGHR